MIVWIYPYNGSVHILVVSISKLLVEKYKILIEETHLYPRAEHFPRDK